MDRKFRQLNLAILLWFSALLAWCLGLHSVASYAGLCAAATFIIFTLERGILPMFKKHKNIDVPPTVSTPAPTAEQAIANGEKHITTVIASDVHFEGNIFSTSPVYIHGRVEGNIEAKECLIKVMREGKVEGNIVCRELIIDGTVMGQCVCDTVEVYENGRVTGTLAYRTLGVKKGGHFSGQAELLPPVQQKTNVVGLVVDAVPETKLQHLEDKSGQKKSQHPAG